MPDSFKACPMCGRIWVSRESLLSDMDVELIGYQTNFEELAAGLFLFNHRCQATFAIPAGDFEDLYDGPVFRERATESDQCPGHCLHQSNLQPCPAHCECAFVREIMQVIRNWNAHDVTPSKS